MPTDVTTTRGHDRQSYWRALYYFNLYRLVLGVAFVTIGISRGDFATLGERWPTLFLASSLALAAMAIVNLISITQGKPSFRIQAHVQFAMDAVLITLLGSASGGISSGLHLLLLVSVAAGGVVLSGRMNLFFAALGSVLALTEHTASILIYPQVDGTFTQVGLLGIGLFSTSLVIYFIAERLRQAEAIAQRRAADLLNLSKLNELIVARLDTGIIVVDRSGQIKLRNTRATQLLQTSTGSTLEKVNANLYSEFIRWQEDPQIDEESFTLSEGEPSISVRWVPLSTESDSDVVIFLEDLSQTEQHAQQLKLAALGRLSAAVAHEIRNPLGAISHAGQLIKESDHLSDSDRRLAQIVNHQSDRINQIIKSILRLGRPDLSQALHIKLDPWLRDFRKAFIENHRCEDESIVLEPTILHVDVDPDHLNQVLTNLCENSLRHGQPENGGPTLITISGGRLDGTEVSYLDVANNGPVIPAEIREKMFEPFFTTTSGGSGLGLYLSRELCHANNARLIYLSDSSGGKFRIRFSGSSHKDALPSGV